MRRRWTDEKILFLKNNYSTKGCSYCSKKLKLSLSSIKNKCCELNIHPYRPNLVETHPKLALEWHPTKNGDDKPENYSKGSHKKVWWLLPCGHETEQTILNRYNGIGCPYCSKRGRTRLLKGFNDLQTKFPEIAKEFSYKNLKTSSDYLAYANRKVLWVCSTCQYEWNTTICERTSHDQSGCPKCKRSKLEKETAKILDEFNIKYEIEYNKFNIMGIGGGLLRFDFYLYDYNTVIECQGQQHYGEHIGYFEKTYKITQTHDKIKRKFCKDNKIKLIEIPYTSFNNIRSILKLNFYQAPGA
jgi:hypothetical protein